MKTIALFLVVSLSLLTAGCVETALVAVNVVNAVDSVADMASRHEEKKQRAADEKNRAPSQWDGQSINDLFVSWGQPGQIYHKHPDNQFGGRSYIWNKSCGQASQGIEGRSLQSERCQVYVHADRGGKIRELIPGTECGPCYGLLNPY